MEHVVKMSGTDALGQPFRETTSVIAIEGGALRLSRVPKTSGVGDRVTLHYRSATQNFRISSIGPGAEARLVATDSGPSLFDGEKTAQAPCGATANRGNDDRRRHPRLPCLVPVTVALTQGTDVVSATMNDLSASGCYVNMFSPFSRGTQVIIASSAICFRAEGKVVSSDPTIGMGIRFTQEHPEVSQLDFHSGNPLETDSDEAAPSHEKDEARVLEDLIQHFRENTSITRQEFFALLNRPNA